MILITGATGQYGGKVIEHLLRKGVDASQLIGLVRDAAKGEALREKGIELRVGDYTNIDSLVDAFQGVDKLLLVSSNDRGDVANRTTQHINAIKAAKAAQVKHIVYTSFVRKPDFDTSVIAAFLDSHRQTEQFIQDSGLEYTILQNGIYLEMIPILMGTNVLETGAIQLPAQAGKASWVLRDELAEAAAHILTTTGHANKIYPLTNTESTSFSDVAEDVSQQVGKVIRYESPSVDAFQSALTQAGVPAAYIGMFTVWSVAVAEGMLDVQDTTLASFLDRQPTMTKQFIDRIYAKK